MSKMIPVEESFAEWRKDPNYVEAYDALEDEFSLAAALIEARAHAGLTCSSLPIACIRRRRLLRAWKTAA